MCVRVVAGTGIALVGGVAVGSIGYLFSSQKYKAFLYTLQQYPVLNALVKAGVVFPLAYHYLGGLRHLVCRNVLLAAARCSI